MGNLQELRWVLQNLVGMKLPPPGEEDDRFLQNVEEREIGIELFGQRECVSGRNH